MAKQSPLRLLGFNLKNIEAMKNPDFQGQIEIKSNINLNNIEKHKLDLAKQDALKIDFDFDISYAEDKLGKISLKGTLFISSEPKIQKQILNQWKDKKLDSEYYVAILNIIVQKTSLKAFKLEEELGLPIHVQLPRLAREQNK